MDEDDDGQWPVVVDAGSSMLRAGIAGNDVSSCNIPTAMGSRTFFNSKTDGFVGDQEENAHLLSFRYPIQRGIVTDWNDMEVLMSHCYKQLNVDSKDRPLLYAVPPLNPRSEKEKLAQLMFETFESPAISLVSSSYLCLYACGRHSGVMVNIGDGVSFAVPFHESHCMKDAIHRQDFAGQDVTSYLQRSLMEKGHSFTTTSEFENVRQIKDELSYTALDFNAEMGRKSDEIASLYKLYDGSSLRLEQERFHCMEALFQPSKFGFLGFLSIQEMIHRTLELCAIDTKANALPNIILTGATVLNPGFTERLRKEMILLSPKQMRVNVISYPESPYSVWIGGSILGSLSAFPAYLISKQKYEEYGPSAMGMFKCT